MTDFIPDAITKIDEIESFFSVHKCDRVVQHYVESIKVPKTVTLTKFRDGDLTEYRFTGKQGDVEVLWDYFRFNIVFATDRNERYQEVAKRDKDADSFLNIRLKQKKHKALVEMRVPYDGVYFTINASDPDIYHLTGKYYRLQMFLEWFKNRFPEKSCW